MLPYRPEPDVKPTAGHPSVDERRRSAGRGALWTARLRQLMSEGAPASEHDAEEGSAVLEFVVLGVLLLIPVVYLVLTVGQLQGGSFAVVGAADQAAKVFVAAPTAEEAHARARAAALLTLSDFHFAEEQASIEITCDAECLTPGSSVQVMVRLDVPLPLLPDFMGSNPSVATVDAVAVQIVERFG